MLGSILKKILSLFNLKIHKIKKIILSEISFDDRKDNNLIELTKYRNSNNKNSFYTKTIVII